MKKTVQIKELKEKDEKTLIKELDDENRKLSELKFKAAFRKIKNFHEITEKRKNIARIWTILNQKLDEKLNKEK